MTEDTPRRYHIRLLGGLGSRRRLQTARIALAGRRRRTSGEKPQPPGESRDTFDGGCIEQDVRDSLASTDGEAVRALGRSLESDV